MKRAKDKELKDGKRAENLKMVQKMARQKVKSSGARRKAKKSSSRSASKQRARANNKKRSVTGETGDVRDKLEHLIRAQQELNEEDEPMADDKMNLIYEE